jgi:hypothetical protein
MIWTSLFLQTMPGYLSMALKDKRVACLERHIVTPDQIAENLMGNCSPYLYKMAGSLQKYKALWRHMEIPISFNAEKFIFFY